MKYKVSYSIKQKDERLLVDKTETFNTIQEAINFVKRLRANNDLVGNPTMENA